MTWHVDLCEQPCAETIGANVLKFILLFQGQLSLQKLWFYIQPCMRTMEILSSIAVAIDKVINQSGVLNDVTVVYLCINMC